MLCNECGRQASAEVEEIRYIHRRGNDIITKIYYCKDCFEEFIKGE